MAGAHAATPEPLPQPARKPHGRRRAESPPTEPDNLATASLPLLDPPATEGKARHRGKGPQHGGKKLGAFAVAGVTGSVMLIQMGFTPQAQTIPAADAAEPATGSNTILADPAVILHHDEPEVAAEHVLAPAVVEIKPIDPVPVPPPVPAAPQPAQAPVLQAPAPAAPPPPPPAPVVVPPAPPAAPASKAAAIYAAARAQLGWQQDCTMLVTNALANVGIHFHDWPAGYLTLGYQVSMAEAVPGDLLYYVNGGAGVAHIAVYAGNGMAIHGGWNGNQTVEQSATVGYPIRYSPTAVIRVA